MAHIINDDMSSAHREIQHKLTTKAQKEVTVYIRFQKLIKRQDMEMEKLHNDSFTNSFVEINV